MDSKTRFEAEVSRALAAVPRGSTLLLAVSGGADSTAMLAAVSRMNSDGVFFLRCVHVVHGLRPEPEGEADADHVRGLCDRFAVPCVVVPVERGLIVARAARTGRGVEDAARRVRRRILDAEADRIGAARILLGHTDDDLLETVLMRFLRGAGPGGLAALPRENGRILRPLLSLSRSDVLAYLRASSLPFREDSTNADTRYARNRVRMRLIPALDAEFPGWRSAVRGLALTQAAVSRLLASEADGKVIWAPVVSEKKALKTDLRTFFAADPIVRAEAIYRAADEIARPLEDEDRTLRADPPPSADRDPKRAAIELFASGEVNAQNLGKVRALKRESSVVVEELDTGVETAFSILVEDEGSYRFGEIAFSLGKDSSERAVAVRIPSVVRSAGPAELSRLRASFRGLERNDTVVFVVQDVSGVTAVAVRSPDGAVKLFSEASKRAVADYASVLFFSIL